MKPKLLLAALIVALAGSCADDDKPAVLERSSSSSAKTTGLRVDGLVRVGDAPSFDSSSVTIQCVDERSCWINTPRTLWRSIDGGRNWQEVYRAPQDDEILTYRFVRSDIGWLISTHKLLVTNNGGLAWIEKPFPIKDPSGDVRSLWFLDDGQTGWLAGGMYRPQTEEEVKYGVPNNTKDTTGKKVLEEAIYRTIDGGISWEPQRLPRRGIGRIMLIRFLNDQRGLAVSERSIYFTTDGGRNWREVSLKPNCVRKEYLSDDYEASPSSVAMLDDMTWWVAYDDGRIITTKNGGVQWCDLIHPNTVDFETVAGSPTFFEQVHLDSPEYGWGLGSDRFLYETKDGGSHWTRVTSKIRFNSMTFPTRHAVLLVSESGVFRTGK